MLKPDEVGEYVDSLPFSNSDRQVRLICILSAAIAVCNNQLTRAIIIYLKTEGIERKLIYETILQSYLFLGFPRMIEAALVFNEVFGNDERTKAKIKKYSAKESERWFNKGRGLCQIVYGRNYHLLEKRFREISPEIFRWMVIEGYGKVLSRPGMTQIERELAEVAALTVDKRERQLLSHIVGSLNVGVDIDLIHKVNGDIKPIAGSKAFRMAKNIISEIEKKNEAQK